MFWNNPWERGTGSRRKREWILLSFFLSLFFILAVRLYKVQILAGEEYAQNVVMKTKREILLKGTRGHIYDRKGRLLAGNRPVYSVTLEDSGTYKTNRERQLKLNSTIFRVMRILEKNGDQIEKKIPIRINSKKQYEYTKEGTSLLRWKADVFGKAKIGDLTKKERNLTAGQMAAYLSGDHKFCLEIENGKPYSQAEKRQYQLPKQWSREDKLVLMGIRYELSLKAYQKYLPVIVAEEVSKRSAAAIMEQEEELTGVKIQEDSIRYYEGGEAMASILGYTGTISSEELEKKGEPYHLNSLVGKTGMEKYLDEKLMGQDGVQEVFVNNTGKILYNGGIKKQPGTGQDVYLTIDKKLQMKIYEILEKQLSEILLNNMIPAKRFDPLSVSDASDIQIPVYHVYEAFFENHVLDIERFGNRDASRLEQEIYRRFQIQRKKAKDQIRAFLRADTKRKDWDEEEEAYALFLTQQLDLIDTAKIDQRNTIYQKWKNKDCSLKEFLKEAGKKGWIFMDQLGSREGYFSEEELYQLLSDTMIKKLEDRKEFDILVYCHMLLKDQISPTELCLVLYEQGVLKKQDQDGKDLKTGRLSAYEFIRKKIRNREITPAMLALSPCSASAVVTETNTGRVLACVSYPGYDNNKLANDMDEEYYDKLYRDRSNPLYNRAILQLSAPGSTFKPITVIAGIEEGVINEETKMTCDGIFDKVSPPLRCWNRAGHGKIKNAADALAHSCNDYLCDISYRLGKKNRKDFSDQQALHDLQKYARLFSLDQKTGIELGESSPKVSDQYGIPSAIGQGTHNFSTVQLGRYGNTLANRGRNYPLTLIKKIGNTEKKNEADKKISLSKTAWDAVQKGMKKYVDSTGIFRGVKFSVAGKSGTAQESKLKPDHALFIGYAPTEEPEVSVAVRIVNGYESANAVAGARKILEAYFEGEE